MVTDRPAAAVVHRRLRGQSAQAVLNLALRVDVSAATTPAGQVSVPNGAPGPGPASVKSAVVKPPSMTDFNGHGLITAASPACSNAANIAPLP
jgi:hypothetical protein